MIPLPSAGVQPRGHPLRLVNSGSGNPDTSQASVQSEVSAERLPMPVPQPQFRQQPAVIDLTTGGGETQEREPPAKRQRLDVSTGVSSGAASPAPSVGSGSGSGGGGGEWRSAPGIPTTPRPPSTSWRGRPVWSFQSLLSETPGAGDPYGENAAALAQGGKPASPPPMPIPSWKYAPQEPSGGNRSSEGLPSKEVQTTPYRIETPPVAPAIRGESEYTPVLSPDLKRKDVAN